MVLHLLSYEVKCIDSAIVAAGFSDEMLELLLFAVRDLRKSLKDQGSNLMIRFGSAEIVIPELAKEVVTYLVCLL